MNSIKKWLQNNGFTFKEVMLTGGKSGIMVDTDYNGPYPTKECIGKQRIIKTKIRRFKNIKVESRGYCTAMLITEA